MNITDKSVNDRVKAYSTYFETAPRVPLVTDLDNTLIKTDSLWEGVFCLLGRKTSALFILLLVLFRGRIAVKRYLLKYCMENSEYFPVNTHVQAALETAHAKGWQVYMASAAARPVAERIGGRFPFISEVFASDGECNLKGKAKADFLVQKFGEKGFDYIGDCKTDIPVWRAAKTAFVVSADKKVHELALKANANCHSIPCAAPSLSDYARAFRIQQWVKNTLLFLPLILAHDFSARSIWLTILAFFSFSCGASAIYIANDLIDLASDRKHSSKYKRPFAAGDIPLKTGVFCFWGAILCAAGISFFLPWRFGACLLVYIAATLLYTAYIKRCLLLDVITLACLYVLRMVAGALTTSNILSNWLLGFGIFFFLGLATLKRIGELHNASGPLSGRAYLLADKYPLISTATASGFAAVLVAALYIDSLQAEQLYANPMFLWLFCPLLLYWFGRLLILAHRGEMSEDPVAFAIHDRNSLICVLCAFILLFLAM